jgi:hypothetical protein
MLPELDETKHPLRNLLLAPIWGLIFIMFLPFIGFYLVFEAIATKVFKSIVMQPPTVVGTAYVSGQEPAGDKSEDLVELEAKVKDLRSSANPTKV